MKWLGSINTLFSVSLIRTGSKTGNMWLLFCVSVVLATIFVSDSNVAVKEKVTETWT